MMYFAPRQAAAIWRRTTFNEAAAAGSLLSICLTALRSARLARPTRVFTIDGYVMAATSPPATCAAGAGFCAAAGATATTLAARASGTAALTGDRIRVLSGGGGEACERSYAPPGRSREPQPGAGRATAPREPRGARASGFAAYRRRHVIPAPAVSHGDVRDRPHRLRRPGGEPCEHRAAPRPGPRGTKPARRRRRRRGQAAGLPARVPL